ncbi:MAG: hypothetical protein HQL69_06175 [Magnetococcales bacterium]|nr:hypothetical protein [Magnetococcales bacterium]
MSVTKKDPDGLQALRANRIVMAGKLLGLIQEEVAAKAGCRNFVTIRRGINGEGFKYKYVVNFAKATNTHIGIYSDKNLSDEEFEEEVNDGLLKEKKVTSIQRIQPYETNRWKSFLEKFPDSDKIQIEKIDSPEDESLKGIEPVSAKSKYSIPKFKSEFDQITLKIDFPRYWYLVVIIFSNDVGWSTIPPDYQHRYNNSKIKHPPATIPDPSKELEPLKVTQSGIQWIIAVTSIERLPVSLIDKLVDHMDVEYGVSDLFVHIDGMAEDKVKVMVKRFEVIK